MRPAANGPIERCGLAIEVGRFQEAGEKIDAAESVLIVSHRRPDGDAIGSTLAVSEVLRLRGKRVVATLLDPTPLRYLPLTARQPIEEWDQAKHADKIEEFDVVIVLDTASWSQLDLVKDALSRVSDRLIVVDHHQTRDGIGGIHLIDRTAAATGLLVYEWFKILGWSVPRSAMDGLFAAIATDTGWFRFSNADERAFRAASEMVQAGVASHEMYETIYWSESVARVRLMSRALASLEFHSDGRLAVMALDQECFESCGAQPSDSEDLINEPMRIGSVLVSILLIEQPDGQVRMSLRSKGQVNVAEVAAGLGGGGHARAAGAQVPGPVSDARIRMTEVLGEALGRVARDSRPRTA